MKKRTGKKRVTDGVITVIVAMMALAGLGFVTDMQVGAVTKPGKVTYVRAVGISATSATIKWKAAKNKVSGYTVYRNGKAIRNTGKKTLSIKESKLKASTTYKYRVRAYRTVKQKQWYNKNTKKWQAKKPAKKNRGKSRIAKVRLYGKYSPVLKFKTGKAPAKAKETKKTVVSKDPHASFYGRTIKASQCPVTFAVDSSRCPYCKKAGITTTITYSNEQFLAKNTGVDYSKTCHHCQNIDLKGYCTDSRGEIRWFVSKDGKEGELNTKTRAINEKETWDNHHLLDEHGAIVKDKDNKPVLCKSRTGEAKHTVLGNLKNPVYCFSCGKVVEKPSK